MDKLEVVNMLLRAIGSSPVNSLSTSVGGTGNAHPDVAAALAVMDRVRKARQKKAWWFNTDYQVTLVPDATGVIKIPEFYVSVDIDDQPVIVRGKKLYHTVRNSYQFDSEVVAKEITLALDWDDMPNVFQEYCAYQAMAEYIRDELEDPQKEQSAMQDAARCLIEVKNIQLRMMDFNVFNRPRVRQATYPRSGPLARHLGVSIP